MFYPKKLQQTLLNTLQIYRWILWRVRVVFDKMKLVVIFTKYQPIEFRLRSEKCLSLPMTKLPIFLFIK